jgi:hypothetical protein
MNEDKKEMLAPVTREDKEDLACGTAGLIIHGVKMALKYGIDRVLNKEKYAKEEEEDGEV